MNKLEKELKRFKSILWKEKEDDICVNEENLQKYLKYISDNLELPCVLTWREDFDWEEKYVFWYWDEAEYAKLKRTRPSYTDTFKFIVFEKFLCDEYGLLVKVKRESDRKTFVIWLYWLTSINQKSNNYQLIEDYASWHANY